MTDDDDDDVIDAGDSESDSRSEEQIEWAVKNQGTPESEFPSSEVPGTLSSQVPGTLSSQVKLLIFKLK